MWRVGKHSTQWPPECGMHIIVDDHPGKSRLIQASPTSSFAWRSTEQHMQQQAVTHASASRLCAKPPAKCSADHCKCSSNSAAGGMWPTLRLQRLPRMRRTGNTQLFYGVYHSLSQWYKGAVKHPTINPGLRLCTAVLSKQGGGKQASYHSLTCTCNH